MKMKTFTLYSILSIVMLFTSYSFAQDNIMYPMGGERISNGNPCTIKWKGSPGTLIEPVNIVLWDGRKSAWVPVVSNFYTEKNLYIWNVPKDLVGDRFRIRIEFASTGKPILSSTFFSITSNVTNTVSPQVTLKKGEVPFSLKVFPNPANEKFLVSWEGKGSELIIRNLTGGEVFSQDLSTLHSSTSIGTSGLSSGTYFIYVRFSDGHEENQKVIIQ